MDLGAPFYMVRLVYKDTQGHDPAHHSGKRPDTWVRFDDENGEPTNITQDLELAKKVVRQMRHAFPEYEYQIHQFSHEVYHEDA